jgi:YD repeat-containing protein
MANRVQARVNTSAKVLFGRRLRRTVGVGLAVTTLAVQTLTGVAAANASAAHSRKAPAAMSVGVPPPSTPPATPAAQAAASGQPVEIPADSTEYTNTYAVPRGGFDTRSSTVPLNYLASSGSWLPINNNLVTDTASSFSMRNAGGVYSAQYPQTLGSPVEVSIGSVSVSFALAGAGGSLVSSGGTATYAGALPGVDVAYSNMAQEVEESLSLASVTATSSYVFNLTMSAGVSLSQDGSAVDVMQGAQPVAEIPGPTLTDADGVSGPISQTLTGSASKGWTLTVTPSASWLAAPSRAFPVTVDPSIIPETATNYCGINDYTATTSNCPNNGVISVGAVTHGSTIYPERALANFSISSIPYDSLISEADISAYDSAGSSEQVQAIPVAQAWNTNATWDDSTSSTAWTTPGGSTDSGYTASGYVSDGTKGSSANYDWVVTGAVQDQLANKSNPSDTGIVNHGFLLEATNEGTAQTVAISDLAINIYWQARIGDEPGINYNKTSLDDEATFGIDPANENGELTTKILSSPGVGENLAVNSYYNTFSGWTVNLGQDVSATASLDNSFVFTDGTGATTTFARYNATQETCQAGSNQYPTDLKPPADSNQCAHEIGLGTAAGTVYLVNPDSGSYETFGGTSNADADGSGPYLLTGQTDRNGDTISYAYNSSGQLSTITDTEGHVFDVTIDADNGEPSQIAGPVGATGSQYRTWQFSWGTTLSTYQDLNTYTDPTGAVTHYYYGTNGYLDEILAPGTQAGVGGAVTPTETTLVTSTTGATTSFTQDDSTCPSGTCTTSLSSQVAPQPEGFGSNACTAIASGSDPLAMVGCTTVTDPNHNATSYGWTDKDGTVKTIDPADNVTYNSFDPTTNQLDSSTDALGNTNVSTFNSNLDATSETAPASAGGQTAAMSNLAYNTATYNPTAHTGTENGANMPSSGVDANGNCTHMDYDTNGNMTSEWAGLASTGTAPTKSCADPTGTPAAASNTVNHYKGDSGTSACTALTGELCSTTSPNGNTTTYTYNSIGQLTAATPPAPENPTTYTYDANGRVASVTDGAGRTTTYTYDGDNRVLSSNYDASGDPGCTDHATCISYSFDPNGNELAQTDGTGTTSFVYNQQDQTTAQTLPGAVSRSCNSTVDTAIHYTYTADGQLASYCDAGGTVTYTYNTLDQLTGVADPGGSCSPGAVVQPCISYTYDQDGHAATTTWPTSTGAMQCDGYDNAGNLLHLVAVNGTCTVGSAGAVSHTGTLLSSLTYAYTTSAAPTADTGLKQSIANNVSGLTTTYTYSSQAQLHSAIDSGADTDSWVYTYDADGNIQTKQVGGGAPAGFTYNADDEQQVGGNYVGYNGAGD